LPGAASATLRFPPCFIERDDLEPEGAQRHAARVRGGHRNLSLISMSHFRVHPGSDLVRTAGNPTARTPNTGAYTAGEDLLKVVARIDESPSVE